MQLCTGKDSEVVEYALSRSVSPALIAEYQTRLPDSAVLRRKLHEFYQLAKPKIDAEKKRTAGRRRSRLDSALADAATFPCLRRCG